MISLTFNTQFNLYRWKRHNNDLMRFHYNSCAQGKRFTINNSVRTDYLPISLHNYDIIARILSYKGAN